MTQIIAGGVGGILLGLLVIVLFYTIQGALHRRAIRKAIEERARRLRMRYHQRENKPWFNYTKGRLHDTIAR